MTGTTVRKIDDPVKALGAHTGISRFEVSRICADVDEQVAEGIAWNGVVRGQTSKSSRLPTYARGMSDKTQRRLPLCDPRGACRTAMSMCADAVVIPRLTPSGP